MHYVARHLRTCNGPSRVDAESRRAGKIGFRLKPRGLAQMISGSTNPGGDSAGFSTGNPIDDSKGGPTTRLDADGNVPPAQQ
ncbi:hypothetical protein ACLKA7_007593 [Drosophila subpalustris]